MKCPICGSEMHLTVCEPHICPKCLFAAFPNQVEKLHAIISEKEQAAEKRGAEQERERVKPLVEAAKEIRNSTCCGVCERISCDKCLVGKDNAIFDATLKAYEEGNNA